MLRLNLVLEIDDNIGSCLTLYILIIDLFFSTFLKSVTFAILGEKTTVMSPEVFITAGIPCCRYFVNNILLLNFGCPLCLFLSCHKMHACIY